MATQARVAGAPLAGAGRARVGGAGRRGGRAARDARRADARPGARDRRPDHGCAARRPPGRPRAGPRDGRRRLRPLGRDSRREPPLTRVDRGSRFPPPRRRGGRTNAQGVSQEGPRNARRDARAAPAQRPAGPERGPRASKDEGMDTYDLASDARDKEINLILSDRDREKVQAIDEALGRVDGRKLWRLRELRGRDRRGAAPGAALHPAVRELPGRARAGAQACNRRFEEDRSFRRLGTSDGDDDERLAEPALGVWRPLREAARRRATRCQSRSPRRATSSTASSPPR